MAIPYTNALDITWTLPAGYDIPNDGTTATMTCAASDATGTTFMVW
jgi:hypothetical protein